MESPGPVARALEEFEIDEERSSAGTVLVTLRGEADLHAAPTVRDRLLGIVEAGTKAIVVDLSQVTFLDSMMLGVLLGALKRARAAGGELRVVLASSHEIHRLFEITRLDGVFALDASREAAFSALEPSSAA